MGEHTCLGPKATAPITVTCLSPDLTLGVSSSLQCGDTRCGAIKSALNPARGFVNRPIQSPGWRQINVPVGDRHLSSVPGLPCKVNAKFWVRT